MFRNPFAFVSILAFSSVVVDLVSKESPSNCWIFGSDWTSKQSLSKISANVSRFSLCFMCTNTLTRQLKFWKGWKFHCMNKTCEISPIRNRISTENRNGIQVFWTLKRMFSIQVHWDSSNLYSHITVTLHWFMKISCGLIRPFPSSPRFCLAVGCVTKYIFVFHLWWGHLDIDSWFLLRINLICLMYFREALSSGHRFSMQASTAGVFLNLIGLRARAVFNLSDTSSKKKSVCRRCPPQERECVLYNSNMSVVCGLRRYLGELWKLIGNLYIFNNCFSLVIRLHFMILYLIAALCFFRILVRLIEIDRSHGIAVLAF